MRFTEPPIASASMSGVSVLLSTIVESTSGMIASSATARVERSGAGRRTPFMLTRAVLGRRPANLEESSFALIALHGHAGQPLQCFGGVDVRRAADHVRRDHVRDVVGVLLAAERARLRIALPLDADGAQLRATSPSATFTTSLLSATTLISRFDDRVANEAAHERVVARRHALQAEPSFVIRAGQQRRTVDPDRRRRERAVVGSGDLTDDRSGPSWPGLRGDRSGEYDGHRQQRQPSGERHGHT